MKHVDITVSIVCYNSKKVIRNCIDSVIATTKTLESELIVIDNCSEDGTAEFVKSWFPDLQLIQNEENVGFGRAHNQSFRLSTGRYFLILNPDTVVFPGTISTMVEFMDKHPDVGASGPKIFWDTELNFVFPDLKLHTISTALFHFTSFCRLFPDSTLSKTYWKSAQRLWDATEPIEVEGITGGMLFVRREAFPLFDENFFLFFEEHDLLRKMKKAGWKIYYIPGTRILHYFEESFRNSTIDLGTVYLQSAQYYYRKYYKWPGIWLLKALIRLNPYIEKWFGRTDEYEKISLNGRSEISITWSPVKDAAKYLVEVCYTPNFVDRAGTYVSGSMFSFSPSLLKQLPGGKGFLRILPVYADGSTGKAINVIQVTE